MSFTMSSSQRILLFAILSLCSLHLAAATPIFIPRNATPANSQCTYPTPSLPSDGESTSLPQPLSNLKLKHVTIGSGVQNYTCKHGQSSPTSIGALATLYDATALAYSISPSALHSIPGHTARQSLTSVLISGDPLSLAGSAAADSDSSSLAIIGSHYFNEAGTPVFDLYNVREILFGKKIADVPAPKDAARGSGGSKAVDWLALVDNGAGESVGLGEVFRVETAGGSAGSSCKGWKDGKVVSVQYAAEYWFYG